MKDLGLSSGAALSSKHFRQRNSTSKRDGSATTYFENGTRIYLARQDTTMRNVGKKGYYSLLLPPEFDLDGCLTPRGRAKKRVCGGVEV